VIEIFDFDKPKALAAEMHARIQALPRQRSATVRAVRKEYTKKIKDASPTFVIEMADELVRCYGYRGEAYELVHAHKGAFKHLREAELERLGEGLNSWWSVDSFGCILSGQVWRDGQVGDEVIHRWAHSEDYWWRRAALVSTVPLNIKARGGSGDVPRTLAVCRLLVADHEDMVVKAMSWALRCLVQHDPDAVRAFLAKHEAILAARVKREVRNKLETGLKNPHGRKR
jgi:3-methyladenine DNA glycosylase AlkD